MPLCDYGCNGEAKYKLKNGKLCCSKTYRSCLGVRNKHSISVTGEKHPLFGKKFTEESKKKMSLSHIGKKLTDEQKRKIGQKSLGRKIPKSKETRDKISKFRCGKCFLSRDFIEKQRNIMLNGRSYEMIKKIKKISNEESKLREMVSQIYYNCQFQYRIFNYSIDIALPEYKIAIEYDGYYHFDNKDLKAKIEKEYYIIRRKKIENVGWKFIRYTIFDKFPTVEELHNKIKERI